MEREVTGSAPDAVPVAQEVPTPSDLEIGTGTSDSFDDSDSAMGESIASGTTSLRSSIYESIEENGRTYHAYNSGKYMLPNDEVEQERLDLQHLQFKILLDGSLHLAPIKNPRRVLDLATGTGVWAIEFAQEYPLATVTGTDLSPIQPTFVPANLRFEVEDAENDWVFGQSFDYIHARAVVTCFKDNRAMLQKIFDNLAPGGYFELQDPCLPMRSDDGTLESSTLGEWNNQLTHAMSRVGRNICDSQNWGSYMTSIGFTDVTEKLAFVPINPWAKGKKNKLLGRMCLQNLTEGLASMGQAAFTRILGWDKGKCDEFLEKAKADLADPRCHGYVVVYFAYGRKPGGEA